MVAKILEGREIAKTYRAGLKAEVEKLKEHNIIPKLTVILVGNDGASQSYVNSKKKAAEKIGMTDENVRKQLVNYEKSLVDKVEEMQNDLL